MARPRPECGAATKSGGRCRWPAHECPWHRQPRSPGEATATPTASLPREPRAVAWWALNELIAGRLDPRTASVVAYLLRILTKLDEGELPPNEAMAAALLRGRLVHGALPGTAEEWALAEAFLGSAVVAEIRRWSGVDADHGLAAEQELS